MAGRATWRSVFREATVSHWMSLGAMRVMSPQKTPDVKRIKGAKITKDHQRSLVTSWTNSDKLGSCI